MISCPIYIAELSPASLRGPLVNVIQLVNVLGINLAVLVGYLVAEYGGGWRLMFASQGVPVAVLILGLLLVPESPRWLTAKGHTARALEVLKRINGIDRARQELLVARRAPNFVHGRILAASTPRSAYSPQVVGAVAAPLPPYLPSAPRQTACQQAARPAVRHTIKRVKRKRARRRLTAEVDHGGLVQVLVSVDEIAQIIELPHAGSPLPMA